MTKKITAIALCFAFALFAFEAQAASVFRPSDAFNVFRKAMGNRYNLLNANNRTGREGALNYIQYSQKIATTTIYNELVTPVPAKDDLFKLTWFKTKFLDNTATTLNTSDKEGINQAMVARFKDFCYASFNPAIANAEKTLKTEMSNLEKAKGVAAALCNKNYSNLIKDKTNFNNLGKVAKLLKEEDFKILRDRCLSDAYALDTANRRTKWTILNTSLSAAENAATVTLNTCLASPQIASSGWVWAR